MSGFAELQADFLRITGETVFCSATTVDERGRPRGRILHPIFVVRDARPLGWVLTGRTPLKSRHLAANPHMSCGYGAAGLAGYGEERWRGPLFTPLRLEPWRIQVMLGTEYPTGTLTGRVWRD